MELSLTVHERHSPLGQKFRAYLIHRIEQLRQQNDQAMPESERHELIAQIAETKRLLRAFTESLDLTAVAP